MKKSDCIFCNIIDDNLPGIEIFRDDICIAIMDIFPISRGHLMVIPLVHCEFSHELTNSVRSHIFEQASMLSKAICRSDLKAKGAHILINDGKAANQHIPHVHMHVIPRYRYDLVFILFRLLTRFINPFTMIGRRKRLGKQVMDIQRALSEL